MSWFFTALLSAFLLPPLNLLLIALAGLLLLRPRPRLARGLLAVALALLWLCATPYISEVALQLLESRSIAVSIDEQSEFKDQSRSADAIVVLGGGTYFSAPEYGGIDTVGHLSLLRLRYAARLQRATGKPILISGGKPLGNALSEAQQMKSTLEQDFNISVQWTEDSSDNTLQGASNSYQILHKLGIKRIYLVTHAWHMPRSVMAFRRAGFEVIPAPMAYTTHYQTNLLSFIPRAESMENSRIFMHELIGLLWYRLIIPL